MGGMTEGMGGRTPCAPTVGKGQLVPGERLAPAAIENAEEVYTRLVRIYGGHD
jgi:hypothetical protein